MRPFGHRVPEYRGVRKYRGRFLAEKKIAGIEHKIAEFDTPEEAARAADAVLIQRRTLLGAFPLLNFPREYQEAYNAIQQERAQKEAEEQERHEAYLKSVIVPEERHGELMTLFLAGTTLQDLAARYGTHVSVIQSTLREIQKQRLASIGLTPNAIEANCEAVVDAAKLALEQGESLRSISARLGFDRRTLSRWLGIQSKGEKD